MKKFLIVYFMGLIFWAVSCGKEHHPTQINPSTDQLAKWEQKLYQDSCTFAVALYFDAKGGKGDRSLEKDYDNYLYGLSKSVEYDRFIIRELKRK